jgi:hypothetical protein
LGKLQELEGNMAVDREEEIRAPLSPSSMGHLQGFSIATNFYNDSEFSGPVKTGISLTFEK